jgi:hypothetical protein
MRAWNITRVGSSSDIGRDTFRDMSSPGAQVQVLLHPLIRGKVCPAQVDRTISCTGGSATKDDWIATKWRLSVVDMALAVAPPIPLVRYPTAAEEAKFGKAAILLMERLVAAVRMRPSLLGRNTNMRRRKLAAKVTNGHAQDGFPHLSISIRQDVTGQRPSMGRRTSWYATLQSLVRIVMRSWRAEMPSGLRSGTVRDRV